MENTEQQTTTIDSVGSRATVLQGTEQQIEGKAARLVPMQKGPGIAAPLTQMQSLSLEQLTGLEVLLLNDKQIVSGYGAGQSLFSYRNTLTNFRGWFTFAALKYCKMIRFEITFHVRILSSPQVQGQLILAYDNMPSKLRELCFNSSNLAYAWRLPRTAITLGHDGDYSITIPWNCPYEKLSTSSTFLSAGAYNKSLCEYDMGEMSVRVVNPISYVAGVTPPSLRIWAEISNVQYSGFSPGNSDIDV